MTPARFAALAAAYGGDIDRWPMADRDAARQHLLAHADAATLLRTETGLDAALRAWVVPGPGAALAGRIVVAASRRRARLRRLRLCLSGLGAAAALSGGVAAGVNLATLPAGGLDQEWGRLYGLRVLGAPLELGGAPGQAPL